MINSYFSVKNRDKTMKNKTENPAPPRPVGRPPGRKKCEHIHVRATPEAVASLAGLSVLLKKSKSAVIDMALGNLFKKITDKITGMEKEKKEVTRE